MWFVGATVAAFVGYWLLSLEAAGVGCWLSSADPPC